MSQTFQLQLATDHLALEAQQLGVPVQQLLAIQIIVRATLIQQSQLHLSYQVQVPSRCLAEQLDWPQWQRNRVKFTDYLWEQTCLECFIASDTKPKTTHNQDKVENQFNYIEINASPSGRYAVYKFNSYRNPSSLPPVPLLQSGKSVPAHINWSIDSNLSEPALNSRSREYNYQRSFTFDLNQLPLNLTAKSNGTETNHDIGLIHPCVILRFNKVVLYFAPTHATPPDFHQSRYWMHFEP